MRHELTLAFEERRGLCHGFRVAARVEEVREQLGKRRWRLLKMRTSGFHHLVTGLQICPHRTDLCRDVRESAAFDHQGSE